MIALTILAVSLVWDDVQLDAAFWVKQAGIPWATMEKSTFPPQSAQERRSHNINNIFSSNSNLIRNAHNDLHRSILEDG